MECTEIVKRTIIEDRNDKPPHALFLSDDGSSFRVMSEPPKPDRKQSGHRTNLETTTPAKASPLTTTQTGIESSSRFKELL